MRDYLRVLSFLLPYRLRLGALLVCIVGASVLSSVGITFVSPLLRILFLEGDAARTEQVVEAPPSAAPAGDVQDQPSGGLPLPEVVEGWKEAGQRWLDEHLYSGSRRDMLLRVCLWLFVLYFLKNLFGFLQEALRVSLEHQVIHDIRADLHRAIQELPLGYFSGERTGYLMSRILHDVDAMRASIVGGLTLILSNGLMVVIALSIVVVVSWQLSLATLLVVPPNMLLVGLISKKLRRGSHQVQEEMGEVASALQENIAGIRVVKAFDPTGRERTRFAGSNLRYYRAYVKLKVLEAMSSPVSELLGVLTAVLILGFGGNLVLQGKLRPDLLVMFLAVMLWVIQPIKSLIKVNSTLQQSLAAARRIFDILDHPRERLSEEGRRDIDGLHEALRFTGVGFAYREGEPVLEDIDLEVRAGQVVAVVGPSGAGKSTLVDMVPRFVEPTTGRITLDGVELGDIHLGTLRGLIGMVTQEVILFHDTVARNIAYGAGDVPRERIVAAAKAANAHGFIEAMPQGYDTPVGERGLQLSGGQRQRLAIARAVLKDPPILILDEATSALDTESERVVQEAMERLMRGRTTLVIAHRLSTVTRADRIVVLSAGQIVEEGTHQELLELGGHYRRLHDLQFQSPGGGAGDPAELAG